MILPKTIAVAGLVLVGGICVTAQNQKPTRVPLPNSIALTEVQITLLRNTGGGCLGRCVHYQITVRGDGALKYEDLAEPPAPARERQIAVEEVVALTNEFVGARFFEASARYAGRSFYILQDKQLFLRGTAAADGPRWDLSFRLGDLEKSVHLYLDYPDYLGHLRDRVDQLGGPQSWARR